jgi:hypothetical protein
MRIPDLDLSKLGMQHDNAPCRFIDEEITRDDCQRQAWEGIRQCLRGDDGEFGKDCETWS